MSTKPTTDPKETQSTTFRDDPPQHRCPECSTLASSVTGTEARCGNGHTWTVRERRVRA